MSKLNGNAIFRAAEGRYPNRSPELLCPAGSPAAFDAAIEGGADAIYIGGSAFNARINAKNFDDDQMREAILRAHSYKTKVYIAANTLIYGKEAGDYLRAAESAYLSGADALIVADLGAAALIKKYIPDIELHASTQLSGHNTDAAKKLAELGFSRMVCAREMSCADLRSFVESSPIEAEVFVHGALCVCHSGQCLFSSVVGGRSGNRGECAQPCRLPYKSGKGKNQYPLSLRDLCLAEHITELCDMGIASFKIEGRMKSAEYVRDVTRIWRTLLDERRNATREEMAELERIFSRGGFTDGYYTGRIGPSMMGVRSDNDKKSSRELDGFKGITRKLPIDIKVRIKRGEPQRIEIEPYGVSALGDIPEEALTSPIDRETVRRSMLKLGSTQFEARNIEIELDEGLMVPVSKLNALRRAATDKVLEGFAGTRALEEREEVPRFSQACRKREKKRQAVFYDPAAVTPSAREYFDVIYLPLERFDGSADGVLMPAVIYDSEKKKICEQLRAAWRKGARHALVGNIGHMDIAREAGFILHGDLRLNACNSGTVAELERLGFEDIVLSPELGLSKIRDISGATFVTVYGRLPLMVTEKCVGREISDCKSCNASSVRLIDRKGAGFPVLRDGAHRSLIFNSVPVYMADREEELLRADVTMRHFIFTVESRAEVDRVIDAYKHRFSPSGQIKRIN